MRDTDSFLNLATFDAHGGKLYPTLRIERPCSRCGVFPRFFSVRLAPLSSDTDFDAGTLGEKDEMAKGYGVAA
jgi:hypothetical protein